MISKLKRRYFISNMTLLSTTFLVGLAILFGILYRSEVQSSYTVMDNLMTEAEFPELPSQYTAKPQSFGAADMEIVPLNFDMESAAGWWDNIPKETEPHQEITTTEAETFLTTTATTSSSTEAEPVDQAVESVTEANAPAFEWETAETTANWGGIPFAAPAWGEYGKWYYANPYYPPPYWQFQNPYAQFQNPFDWTQYNSADPQSGFHDDHGPAFRDDESANISTTINNTEQIGESMTETTTVSSQSSTISPTSEPEAAVQTTTPESVMTSINMPSVAAPETTVQSTTEETAYFHDKYIPDAYIAQIDDNGNVASYAASADEAKPDDTLNAVSQAMDAIKQNGEKSGTIQVDDVPYRFLYQPDQAGNYRLVMLNRSLEISTISRLIFLFVFLLVIGLLCIFVISELLANWTVKPIAAAWEKQKQFVAEASHELKTPLAVISANTDVILANPDASVTGQSKWIHYIQSETTRMSKLITNLLSIARMDNGIQTEKVLPLRISDVVSNVCLVFEPIVFENGKTLNTVIQRNVIFPADEDNLKQLLSILLDNAVLHSLPKAQITVTLSKDAQGKIRLAVSNTAKDIPEDQLPHLFERFYRIDTVGNPSGSGLGLSIAKSIVQQMGGSLTVTSENSLVTFLATFPA